MAIVHSFWNNLEFEFLLYVIIYIRKYIIYILPPLRIFIYSPEDKSTIEMNKQTENIVICHIQQPLGDDFNR